MYGNPANLIKHSDHQQSSATAAGGAPGGLGGQGLHSHPGRPSTSAHGSGMSVPNAKFEVIDDEGWERRHRHWKSWLGGVLGLLTVVGLALGLGLGLGLRKGHNSQPTPPNGTTGANPYNGTGLPVRTPWQIVLSETLTLDDQSNGPAVTPNPSSDPAVSMYDIDMFLHQNLTVVRDLRAQGMEVICYFSAGSYEPNRPDSWKFTDDDKGKELDGWPGEYWLDLNSDNVRQIMTARIEIAAKMNCSGVDPDNVDAYVSCPPAPPPSIGTILTSQQDNENGLGMTEDDSIDFMRFLAQEAGSRGLMTGLKNAGAIIDDVIDYVQFQVNEQCSQYDECDEFSAFPNAGKPVFHIEYPAGDGDTDQKSFDTNSISKYCDLGDGMNSVEQGGFNTVLKYMNLSGFVQYCDEKTFITDGS